MEAEENLRKWRLSRRRFMQILGAAGTATAVSGVLPALTGSARTGDSDASPEEESGQKKRVRRWMMIIDLRRCDGCQSVNLPPQCTEACNLGHMVPEPMQWIEVYEHELSADAKSSELFDEEVSSATSGTRFVPTPCMQCQNPPCVNVCPVGATWSTREGVVLIDQQRCIGCRMCMAACPYERRFFTWGEPPMPPETMFVEYNPTHQMPYKKGVVYKCDFCPEMARAGRLPFCAQACPQNAIYYGDLEEDRATNGEEVVKVSRFLAQDHGFRQKEELGTRPRVYYIPGHGELAGRNPHETGRRPVRWRYTDESKGATPWKRSGP